ncbi:MAG: ABC transporter permease [Gemmatimonadota bacterium]|nr:ABC transporter permease [Gemmatimonadota bacterium]
MSGPWWRIGWRNLGRNPRRSLFTAGGLAVGYAAVVVMTGLGRGMVAEMIGNGTGILSGQLQVHAEGYLPERSVHETIGGREGIDVDALVGAVAADPTVSAAAPRLYGGGLVSAGDHTLAAGFVGIDPAREPAVSAIMAAGETGRLPGAGENELWIGREMARQLDVDAGDIVVVVAPAADGSLGNDLFTVAGVFRSGLGDVDASVAFIPLDALQQLMALPPGRVHEVAARIADPWDAAAAEERLLGELATDFPGTAPRAWNRFQPEMVEYAALFESMEWVIIVVVFIMAVFGVANTMLMATFERRREFALLLAIGTTPGVILRSVIWEAFVLGVVSLTLGAILTFPVLVWWHNAPPDMSWLYGDFTMAGGLIRPVLRVEYPPEMMVLGAVALFATALLAAVLPAYRAGRLPPADTLAGR